MNKRAGVSRQGLLADGATQVAIGSDLIKVLIRKLRLVVLYETLVILVTTSWIAHGKPVLIITTLRLCPNAGHT